MQSNTPEHKRRVASAAPAVPDGRSLRADDNLEKNKGHAFGVLPLLALFIVLLAGMYAVYPKAAGRYAADGKYDGLMISEVMSVIAPGEYKIICLDGEPERSTQAVLHANFSIARAGGETISFCDPTGRVLDRIPLGLIPTDQSYGRTLLQSGFFYYDVPTPGAANGAGHGGYADRPSFSQPGGDYKTGLQITIRVPETALFIIRWTGPCLQRKGVRAILRAKRWSSPTRRCCAPAPLI